MRRIGNGRYELTRLVAAGGMGEVWRATDTALGRTVAVKLLHANLADDAIFRRRFETEARNAAALHDPRIATIFDYGDDVDPETGRHTAYLVMEYVAGSPLADLLTEPLPPARAAELIAQAADGLAVAHAAGIVHRDVKPANFLVTRGDELKVTDFGIARARGASALTESGTILATPYYVSPEVAAGQQATFASDLYSLGVVLYECLAGRRPFVADTPVAVALAHVRDEPPALPASVPRPFAALVESAMSKDPGQRPPSAAQFAVALRSAAAGGTGVVSEEETAPTAVLATAATTQVLAPPAPDPPHRNRRGLWPVVALAALLLIGGAIAWAVLSDGDSAATGRNSSALQGQEQTKSPPQPTTSATKRPEPQQPTTSATRRTQPTSSPAELEDVRVVATDYIGTDVQSAEDQLKALGLTATSSPVPGGRRDIVARVDPTGMVPAHQEIALFVYTGVAPSPSGGNVHKPVKPHRAGKHDGKHHGKHKGKG